MVQVPPGVPPGGVFHANVSGQIVAVQVPFGVVAGQTLQVQVPVSVTQHQQYQQHQQHPPHEPHQQHQQHQQHKQKSFKSAAAISEMASGRPYGQRTVVAEHGPMTRNLMEQQTWLTVE